MLQFVILRHDVPEGQLRAGVHFDWMFEADGELVTFAVDEPVAGSSTSQPLQAMALPNHRLAYLDYEGEVSNNRGVVSQWDKGEYQGGWTSEGRRWIAKLSGQRLVGEVEIASAESNEWQLVWRGEAD